MSGNFLEREKRYNTKKKTKHGEGIIFKGCINLWVTDSLIKYIFLKLLKMGNKTEWARAEVATTAPGPNPVHH